MGWSHFKGKNIICPVSDFFFLRDLVKDAMNYSETPLCEASCTKADNLIQITILKLLVIYFIHALYLQ